MLEMKGKRLLVLGCGYLGRLLVEEAIQKGMRVMAVSRNMDTLADVAKLGADTFCGLVHEAAWHDAIAWLPRNTARLDFVDHPRCASTYCRTTKRSATLPDIIRSKAERPLNVLAALGFRTQSSAVCGRRMCSPL